MVRGPQYCIWFTNYTNKWVNGSMDEWFCWILELLFKSFIFGFFHGIIFLILNSRRLRFCWVLLGWLTFSFNLFPESLLKVPCFSLLLFFKFYISSAILIALSNYTFPNCAQANSAPSSLCGMCQISPYRLWSITLLTQGQGGIPWLLFELHLQTHWAGSFSSRFQPLTLSFRSNNTTFGR